VYTASQSPAVQAPLRGSTMGASVPKVLLQRNFALFWSAGLISMLGDIVLFIALPFGIYLETGSTVATGTLFIVEALPRVLLGAFAGVFADRWNRQRTLVTADVLRALLLLPLVVAHTASTVWLVYLIAFSVQVVGQFFAPAAGALLPRLVTEGDLPPANAWSSLSASFTLLAGPSLGGFLLGVAGWSSIILTDSCSFLLSALLIGCVSLPSEQLAPETTRHPRLAAPRHSFWHDWVVGLRPVARTPLLPALFAISALDTLAGGCFTVLMVPYVHDVLHGHAQLLGWLASAQGGGSIVGGLLLLRLATRVPPLTLLLGGTCLTGIVLLVCFNSTALTVVVALWLVLGLLFAVTGIAARTLLQRATIDSLRGRVLGTLGTINALAGLIGMGIGTAAGAHYGTLPVLDLVAGLSLSTGVLGLSMVRLAARPASAPCAQGREEAHGTLSR
jgi:MFS family permease